MKKNSEFETRTNIDSEKFSHFIQILADLKFTILDKYTQNDIIFDFDDASLFKSGQKIRVRSEKGKIELTYKGTFVDKNIISNRNEINININDENAENTIAFLQCIGYSQLFQIIKVRTIYKLNQVEINIDEWPIIGYLIEIEGPETEIMDLVLKLKDFGYIFRNFRLKELFENKIKTTGKSFEDLKNEYEAKSGNKLGKIELVF